MNFPHLQTLADPTGAASPIEADAGAPIPAAPTEAKLLVQCVGIAELAAHHDAWVDLTRRSLEPNVFLDPSFVLPLLQHVGSHRRWRALLVWEDGAPVLFDRLVGLFILDIPRIRRPGACARGFAHEQTACGTPLVDGRRAAEVLAAVATWLGTKSGRPAALRLDNVARGGPFFAALQSFCADTSREIAVVESWERAVLTPASGAGAGVASFSSAKHRKERARQYRRLSAAGARRYVSARTPGEIAAATELFLALEHRGWKGLRGTSLLADPARATFCRTMTRLMAAQGRCRIDSIEIDGQPVAMGVILSTADRAYFWKTAFDQSYAAMSPGVQFVLELTQVQQSDGAVALTDSCAVARHPMIDRLWPARATMADVIIATRAGERAGFDRSVTMERWRRMGRDAAKALWQPVRRRRAD